MSNLRTKFNQELKVQLQQQLGLSNPLAVPKLEKVIVNMGIGRVLTGLDKQQRESSLQELEKILALITGQKPQKRSARKSIAGFKLRQGDLVGLRVTLRGPKMYDFVERLNNLVFPRLRDFRGLPLKNIDAHGILNIGIKEHIVFPSVSQEEFRRLYSLEITFVPTTRNREQALVLYRSLSFPLQRDVSE